MKKSPRYSGNGGFSLVLILIGVVSLGLIAAMMAPAAGSILERLQYSDEWDALRLMQQDIESDWSKLDQGQSLSMFDGQTGVTNGTEFDPETNITASMSPSLTITSANNWRIKLAALRGFTTGVPQTFSYNSSGLSSLFFNERRWPRILIAGPTNESVQRYVLMSVMTPNSRQLRFPASGTPGEVFNSIYNNAWNTASARPPATWASMLSGTFTAADYALWSTVSSGNRTNAGRVFVITIRQPKYVVMVVNTSTTTAVEVDIGPYKNAIVIPPNSPTPVVDCRTIPEFANGVPKGRWITVRMGAPGSLVQAQHQPLTGDMTVTVQ